MLDGLREAGFDLVQAFDAARYNALIRGHAQLRPVSLFGRERALGILIGNTRALWPAFTQAADLTSEHPLDEHLTRSVEAGCASLAKRHEAHLGHHGGSRLVSMIHAAEASELAARSPVHLAVHPVYGTWFALRALIVVDDEPPATPKPLRSPCEGCPAPCVPALERARQGSSWRDWLALRDACPVGTEHRYPEAQIAYHYEHNRAHLEAAQRKRK